MSSSYTTETVKAPAPTSRPTSRPTRTRNIVSDGSISYYTFLLIVSNCSLGALLVCTVCLLYWYFKREIKKVQILPQDVANLKQQRRRSSLGKSRSKSKRGESFRKRASLSSSVSPHHTEEGAVERRVSEEVPVKMSAGRLSLTTGRLSMAGKVSPVSGGGGGSGLAAIPTLTVQQILDVF